MLCVYDILGNNLHHPMHYDFSRQHKANNFFLIIMPDALHEKRPKKKKKLLEGRQVEAPGKGIDNKSL
jgi:hypothetical protein